MALAALILSIIAIVLGLLCLLLVLGHGHDIGYRWR